MKGKIILKNQIERVYPHLSLSDEKIRLALESNGKYVPDTFLKDDELRSRNLVINILYNKAQNEDNNKIKDNLVLGYKYSNNYRKTKPRNDYTGKIIGQYEILEYFGSYPGGQAVYKGQCLKCGKIITASINNFKKPNPRCNHFTVKRQWRSQDLRRRYKGIKSRYYNPKSKYYMAQSGILCKEWFDEPLLFEQWALDNGFDKGAEINRIDSIRGFCPENCKVVFPNGKPERSLLKLKDTSKHMGVSNIFEKIVGHYKILTKNDNKSKGEQTYKVQCLKCNTVINNMTLREMEVDNIGCYHGKTKWSSKRLRSIYANMIQRCYNENCKNYDLYGGRGIGICNEWRYIPQTFNDWAITHRYKSNLSIDRIDGNGNYCPENCRWVTMEENNWNRPNNVTLYTVDGKSMTIRAWSDYFNFKSHLSRIYREYGKEAVQREIEDLYYGRKTYRENKRIKVYLTIDGKTKTLSKWTRKIFYTYDSIKEYYLYYGEEKTIEFIKFIMDSEMYPSHKKFYTKPKKMRVLKFVKLANYKH